MSFGVTNNPTINAFKANEDIQGSCIVAIDPSENNAVLVGTGTTDPIVGIAYLSYEKFIAEGCLVSVQYNGIASVKLGGTVAPGDKITSDATGAGVTAAAGDNIVGCAIEGGSAGQIISVIVNPGIA